jgi:hypothetical protein
VISGYKKKVFVFLTAIVVVLFSCQKEEEQSVVLLSPFNIYINSEPAKVISLEVTCHSPYEMKQLTITSRIVGSYSKTELDTLISGKDFYLNYEFLIPDLIESGTVILEFTLRDASAGIAKNAKIIEVVATTNYLVETAGHVMFSGYSGQQDGYDLLSGASLFSKLADRSLVHISDTSNSDVLLKRWISPAGIKFVKFTGFDYANCTDATAKDAYNAGIKFDFVDNLAQGDILITKVRNTKSVDSYIVIRIMNIYDESGNTFDKYIFNIKKRDFNLYPVKSF